MPRPALSAARSIDIIEFLAAFSDSAFTLSQVASAIGVNPASCHAILNELSDRGYVTRNLALKTYSLGPSLVAMGNAALRTQGLVARAQAAAHALGCEHGVPVSLTRAIGAEVIGIFCIPGPRGFGNAMRPGNRLPLLPPVGAPFLAWSSDVAIADWIARRHDEVDEATIAGWHNALALVRRRGYQLLLRSPEEDYFPKMISDLASGRPIARYKDQIIDYFLTADRTHCVVESVRPDEIYEVTLIAAPIFDHDNGAIYNLCMGGFPERVSGEAILNRADGLLRSCVQIMGEAA